MNKFQLFKELRHHIHLSDKRSPMWGQNKTAKIVLGISGILVCAYLIFISISLGMLANESKTITGCELLYGLMPIILLVDFFVRFIAQQTPSQLIRPYILMPLPKYMCIDTFVISSMFSWGNLIWFSLFIPYAIMAVVFNSGIIATFGFLLGLYILIIINSQWYLIVRTLVIDKLWWWLLPLTVYGLLSIPMFLNGIKFEHLLNFYSKGGDFSSSFNVLFFISLIAILVIVVICNRRLQYIYTWKELSRSEKTVLKGSVKLGFLDRFGQMGEYLKIEIKSLIRNKNLRKSFIASMLIILLFSLILSFTDLYDNATMTDFWLFYDYALIGIMMLIKVMCYEGNYIDGLMVHKENIYTLLKGKYYLHNIMLLFPFLLLLPTVFTGKCSFLMLFSFLIFTAGVNPFILLQMAVYNKQTIPLNEKFIRNGVENNYIQVIVEMVAFIVPMVVISLLHNLCRITIGSIIMILIGASFMATNKWWLSNIYKRMMKRRYINLEGFRSSRN